MNKGQIIPNGVVLDTHEMATVVFLTEMGKDIELIPRSMLMYGKEASNRKQEIDRQHYTIPNQRPKDKHCGKI